MMIAIFCSEFCSGACVMEYYRVSSINYFIKPSANHQTVCRLKNANSNLSPQLPLKMARGAAAPLAPLPPLLVSLYTMETEASLLLDKIVVEEARLLLNVNDEIDF